MKKFSLILSLFVMFLSNVLTPYAYAVDVNFHYTTSTDEDDIAGANEYGSYSFSKKLPGSDRIYYRDAFTGKLTDWSSFPSTYFWFNDDDYSVAFVHWFWYEWGEEPVKYQNVSYPWLYWTGNLDEAHKWDFSQAVDVYATIWKNVKIKVYNKNYNDDYPKSLDKKELLNLIVRPGDTNKKIEGNIEIDDPYLEVKDWLGYGFYFKEWKWWGFGDDYSKIDWTNNEKESLKTVNFSYDDVLENYYGDRYMINIFPEYAHYTWNYFRYWVGKSGDIDIFTGLDVIVTWNYEYSFDDTNRMWACSGDLECYQYPNVDWWEFLWWSTWENSTWVISSPIIISTWTTLYPVFSKEITLNFNANWNIGLSATSDSCIVYSWWWFCEIDLPTITPFGSNETQWFSRGYPDNHEFITSGTILVAYDDDNHTFYAQSSTGITINLNPNGNTINGDTTPSCTLWNDDPTCQIVLPTITAPTWKTSKWYTTGPTVYENFLSESETINVWLSDNNTTYYAQSGKDIEITVKPNGNQAPAEIHKKCTLYGEATTCPIVLPEITPAEWKVALWYTTGSNYYQNYTWWTIYVWEGDDGATYWAQSSKEITVNFDANGNQKNIWRTFDSCIIRNGDLSCSIDNLPDIEPTDWKAVLWYTTGPTVYQNPKTTLISVWLNDNNITYYAQAYKDIVFKVYPNSNTILSWSQKIGENPYEVTKRIYNDVNSTEFVFPGIEAPGNERDIIWFSIGKDDHVASYQSGDSIELSNSTDYWAQTQRDYEEKTAVFLKSQGIASIGDWNDETMNKYCTPERTYNWSEYDFCEVIAPKITVSAWYKPWKWSNKYVSGDVITLSGVKTYFIAGTESNIYTIYYDLNGGINWEYHPWSYEAWLENSQEISNPTRVGYIFTGWTDHDWNVLWKDLYTKDLNWNVTLLANWSWIVYKITFMGINNAVLENGQKYPEKRLYTIADTFSFATPVRTGYIFQGWRVDEVNEGKNVLITNSTWDKIATALWNTWSYIITYHLDWWTTNNPTSYNFDETPIVLSWATKDGYGFSWWYKNPSFIWGKITIIEWWSNSNIELYAKWTPIEYTISFTNLNGAKLEDGQNYPENRKYTILNTFNIDNPIRTGYDFQGWKVGNVVNKTLLIANETWDKTLEAQWTAKRYTITYNPNWGTNAVNNPDSYTYSDASVTLSGAIRPGYQFQWWYTELNGWDLVSEIPAGAHENYVLYAHWTANTNTPYKVYHYQESLENGRTLKEREDKGWTSDAKVTPAVKSYLWFDSPDGEEVLINPNGSTVVNYYYTRQEHSVTVNYAWWIDSNNDGGPVVYTGKYWKPVKELIPAKPGWAFSWWTVDYPDTIPAEDVVVTAKWKKNRYTITYNNVEYADNSWNVHWYDTTDFFDLKDASWTWYTFNWWYTDPNFTEASKITGITSSDYWNKVLYAKWTPKTNVKYKVIHIKQDLDQNYTIRNVEEFNDGVTATTITVPTKSYPWFTSPKAEKLTINWDWTSEIEYTYARKRYKYTLEGADGVDVRWSTSSDSFMWYETPLTLNAVVDTWYTWWYWSINGENNVFTWKQNTTIKLPAFNSVVKPVVTHDVYTLSFDAAGWIATWTSSLVAQNHYYNDEITLPEVVRAGYIFQGWYTEPNGQGIKYEADTKMPVSNVELYAYWIEGEANVKVEYYLMNLDGSTYPEQPSDKIELQKTTNSTYTGEVKTFTWFNSPNEQSVVVEAEWTSVIKYYYPRFSYSLDLIGLTGFNYVSVVSTNHPDGIEIISWEVQSTNYFYGETITITWELLTGYGMDKWNWADVIGKNSGTPVFTFTMPTQTVTLTPNVTKNTYKATYKDGDRVIAIYDVVYEEAVPTPKAPSKYGYKFTWWRNYPISWTMPANDVELKAMWEAVPVSGWSGGWGGSSSNDNKKTTNTTSDKQQEHNSAELTWDDQKNDDVNKTEEESVKAEEESIKVEQESIKSDEVDNNKGETSMPTDISTSDQWNVSQEVSTAYQWAYKNDVTTMDTIDEANPEGVVTRWHLAKMVVNYAINVLWQELPEKVPSECRWDDWRGEWESQEIKDYAVKACSLGLMWLDMNKFQPRLNVTRAQFGTIMSRLLWWKKYAGGTPYYKKHLNALKENNIMTQIQNPEKRTELRQWVWLMLMRSAENE